MKKWTFALAMCLSLGFFACGGDDNGGSSLNPNEADFSNPTGTLSNDNVDAVANSALDNSIGTNNVGNLPSTTGLVSLSTKAQNFSSCISNQSETGATINYDCLNDVIGETNGCTFGGTATYEIDGDLFSYTYDNVTVNCEGTNSEIDGSATFNVATNVSCYNLTSTTNGTDYTANGCTNADGNILISVDGETFVITDGDASCSGASVTITDSDGTSTISCDVVSEGACESELDVVEVENCTIN